MKEIVIITIAYIILFIPASGLGETHCIYYNYEKIIYNYLKKSEIENTMFFVSEYEDNDKTAILIVEIGKNEGFLIEKRKCVVENIASISYSGKHVSFIIEEVHGGVYSYNRAQNILEKFDKYPFYLSAPSKILQKYNIRKPRGREEL